MNNHRRKWLKEDVDWLLSNHRDKSICELSKYFKRTMGSIKYKLAELNCIRSTGKIPWTQEDVNYLTNNYENMSLEKLGKHLNRSIQCIYLKLRSLNIDYVKRIYKEWTKEEEEKLLCLYNENKNLNEIKKMLGRTVYAIRKRLKKCFGVCQRGKDLISLLKSKNFYISIRMTIRNLTTGSECCICGYNLCIDLHHIDGNRKNNNIDNIASLCPNHHREIEEKQMHREKQLYCVWWRIYSDGSTSEKFNNNNLKENYQSV